MKNLKRNTILMICLILSCVACRKDFIINPSEVPTAFNTTFPYEMVGGLMVIKVEIRGQLYDFVVDSGALTLVSKELAAQLNLKAEFTRKFSGSQKGHTKIGFTTLENITIGGVDFRESNVGIMDFEPMNSTGCYNFDGMIGPGLMQNAIWEIDYQRQEIKIASDEADFDIPFTAENIPFHVNDLLQPKMKIDIGGRTETIKIDLGSFEGIKLFTKTLDKIKNTNAVNKVIDGYGLYSRAINGYGEPTTTSFSRVSQISMGNMSVTDELVTFKTTGSQTIGNQFFKNYRVILSWMSEEMILIPNDQHEKRTITNFGIKPIYNDGQPSIGFIYGNSSAEKIGLRIDDVIVAINGNTIQRNTKSDWCNAKELLDNSTESTLSITINRNGRQMDFILEKMELL